MLKKKKFWSHKLWHSHQITLFFVLFPFNQKKKFFFFFGTTKLIIFMHGVKDVWMRAYMHTPVLQHQSLYSCFKE